MPTLEVDFAGGVQEDAQSAQFSKVRFVNTWADGDTWTLSVVGSLSGNFTVGKGQIANLTYYAAFTLRNRVYLGLGSNFAMSKVGDPTKWEEQDTGAAIVSYVSQYGRQDSVQAFGSFQGRLAVIGSNSIQIWQPDADPNNFALLQTLDNTGTQSPLSVKNIGDSDVIYLDNSGVRSLRTKENSLNGQVNDIGTAIDLTIRAAIRTYGATGAIAVVEPTTRQYWLFLGNKFYVLSYYPQSKILAWSTYQPTAKIGLANQTYQPPGLSLYTNLIVGLQYAWTKGTNATSLNYGSGSLVASGNFTAESATATEFGTLDADCTSSYITPVNSPFVPEKIVVSGGYVYIRTTAGVLYKFDGITYDMTQATIELPWLMLDKGIEHFIGGLQAAFSGRWAFSMGVAPRAASLIPVIDRGSISSASMVEDSTYDLGTFGFNGHGSHVKVKAVSAAIAQAAKLGKLAILFNPK